VLTTGGERGQRRDEFGGVASTPSRRKMPLGRPLPQLKRSPLIPARVARLDWRRCIEDTVSRPVTSPLESTGFRS